MKVDEYNESDNKVELKLSGSLDEDANFDSVPKNKKQLLIIDLEDLKLINSCGIREWIKWIRTLAPEVEVQICKCPKFVVDQINILQGFLPPKSLVLSFYVPYFCEECSLEKKQLFERGVHFKEHTRDQPVFVDYQLEVRCDQCKTAMIMDIITTKFFKFLGVKHETQK